MQLSLITAIFTALAISAKANPIELPTALEARAADAITSLLIYQHINFGGQSFHWSNPDKTGCVTVPGPWQDDLSSLIIGGSMHCQGYKSPRCVGGVAAVYKSQGQHASSYPDLSPHNDQIFSFKCKHL